MSPTVHSRALRRAAELLGGKERLREHLRVSARELDAWLDGMREPPMDVFLKAVDLISGQGAQAFETSRKTIEQARALRREAREVVRDSILAAALQPIRIEQDFLHADFAPEEGRSMVESAIDAALVAARARKGNLQLRCPDGLRIVAHRGFQQAFLDFFARVHDTGAVCGRAMASGARIVVPDVAADPISASAAGSVLLEADVRAVQSTPILAASGELLGMISTHYEVPLQANEVEFDMLDRIAEKTAFWLQGGAAAR